MERLALTNGLGNNGHNSVNGKKFGAGGSTGSPARHPMTNQLTYIKRTLYPSVHKHPYAWPFHEPVDVVKLNLPVSYLTFLILTTSCCAAVQSLQALMYCIVFTVYTLLRPF